MDTADDSPVNTEIKEMPDKVADSIDASNPKGEEFSEKVEEVKARKSSFGNTAFYHCATH